MTIKPEIAAKYLVEDVFKITGRGIVFAGKIIEGRINIGDTIELLIGNTARRRVISGISIFGKLPTDDKIGIMIKCISEEEIEELRQWKPDRVVCEVYMKSSESR